MKVPPLLTRGLLIGRVILRTVTMIAKTCKWLVYFILLLAMLFLTAYSAGEFLIIEKPLPQADVIFVLSGTVFTERTDTAAELFNAGIAGKIVLTKDDEQINLDENGQRRPFGWEWERWNLISKGVPAESIEILPGIVKSTRDEAVELVQVARQQNWNRVLVVTSPFHTRRALWAMNRAAQRENINLEIGILPADKERQTRYWWISAKNWRNVASEYVKFVYYQLVY